ncbi:retrovirus-related pol polyprotein from transposon TNT 1-94 [Tanacetum coccineum]
MFVVHVTIIVFANQTDCIILGNFGGLGNGSVNVKPHQTKRFKRQPRKEWKPVKRVWKPISKPVANSKPQWKPTGRHFSLFEKYPLTRIMESTDMPIELPPSASSSPQITMVSRFTDHKLSDRKAGSTDCSMDLAQPILSSQFMLMDGSEVALPDSIRGHIRNYDMVDLLKDHGTTNLVPISLNDMMSLTSLLAYTSLFTKSKLGQSKKASHPLQTSNTNTEVSIQTKGPLRTTENRKYNGKKYVFGVVDDYPRFEMTPTTLNATVRFVRTDNGTEFVNKTLDGWFESVGISHETSVPRSPQQNGVVERRNRTLMEAARTMLIFAKAPLFLWAESCSHCLKPFHDCLRMNLTEGLTSFKTVQPPPHQMSSVPNRTELELTRYSQTQPSALVKDPEPPSVPPTIETVISEGAPAVTESLLPHQIPLPDTSDLAVEHLFDVMLTDNVFDTYTAPETDSEASSSNSVNIDVTHNNQLPHVQSGTQAHPLETILGIKDRPVSTRKQLGNRLQCDVLKTSSVSGEKFDRHEAGMILKKQLHQLIDKERSTLSLLTQQERTLVILPMEVKPAFLNGELMKLSMIAGFSNPQRHLLSTNPNIAQEILKSLFDSCTPIDTPMAERPNLDEDKGGKLIDPTRFRGMVGSLMYLSASRPDIVFAVCMTPCFELKSLQMHDYAVSHDDTEKTTMLCSILGCDLTYETSMDLLQQNPIIVTIKVLFSTMLWPDIYNEALPREPSPHYLHCLESETKFHQDSEGTTERLQVTDARHVSYPIPHYLSKQESYLQSLPHNPENKCLLQMQKCQMTEEDKFNKAFKIPTDREHVRLKISVWQIQSEIEDHNQIHHKRRSTNVESVSFIEWTLEGLLVPIAKPRLGQIHNGRTELSKHDQREGIRVFVETSQKNVGPLPSAFSSWTTVVITPSVQALVVYPACLGFVHLSTGEAVASTNAVEQLLNVCPVDRVVSLPSWVIKDLFQLYSARFAATA